MTKVFTRAEWQQREGRLRRLNYIRLLADLPPRLPVHRLVAVIKPGEPAPRIAFQGAIL